MGKKKGGGGRRKRGPEGVPRYSGAPVAEEEAVPTAVFPEMEVEVVAVVELEEPPRRRRPP